MLLCRHEQQKHLPYSVVNPIAKSRVYNILHSKKCTVKMEKLTLQRRSRKLTLKSFIVNTKDLSFSYMLLEQRLSQNVE